MKTNRVIEIYKNIHTLETGRSQLFDVIMKYGTPEEDAENWRHIKQQFFLLLPSFSNRC